MQIKDEADLKKLVVKELEDKGVDKSTAEYLAGLYVSSEKGREAVAAGSVTPLGNCNLLGISPG